MIVKDQTGVTYVLHFAHVTNTAEELATALNMSKRTATKMALKRPRRTIVRMHEGLCVNKPCCNAETVAEAWCSRKDPFEKTIGRHIALVRAMDNYGLTPDQVDALMRDYRGKVRRYDEPVQTMHGWITKPTLIG